MYRVKKYNKYNAKSSEYGGFRYHSKFEAGYAYELDMRKLAKDIADWQRQVKISLDVNGYHICNYYVDFKIIHNDGSIEYVEVKGFETETWRLKWKLFEAIMGEKEPDSRLSVVKR